MIYIRKADLDSIEAEWKLIKSMPEYENGFVNPYLRMNKEEFSKAVYEMMEHDLGIDVPAGQVPETTFFIALNGSLIGQARVRHYLNEALRKGSGHISYWILPQYRGKGYGTEALRLILQYGSKLISEEEFCLTTGSDNTASQRIIEKNGGVKVGEKGNDIFFRIGKPETSGDVFTVRPLRPDEFGLLDDFLYEAIFVPAGVEPPPRDIIKQPELSVYTEGFGTSKHDCCLGAELDGRIVGAVWTRIMNDYGHIDDSTPSFAIAVYKDYRSRGIGTALMNEMLSALRRKGYKQASLAVQKQNRAVGLYRKTGFIPVADKGSEYIMVCDLVHRKGW